MFLDKGLYCYEAMTPIFAVAILRQASHGLGQECVMFYLMQCR